MIRKGTWLDRHFDKIFMAALIVLEFGFIFYKIFTRN